MRPHCSSIQLRRDPWAPETDDEQRPGIHGRPGSERVSAGRSVLPRDPGPPGRLVPSRRPFRPRPCAAGLRSLPQPQWALPSEFRPPVSVSSAPYHDSPRSASGRGLRAVPLFPPSGSGPSLHSADTYFGSSLILFLPVRSRLSASSLPPARASCF